MKPLQHAVIGKLYNVPVPCPTYRCCKMMAIYYDRASGARVGSEAVPAYLVNGYDYIERICQADNVRADVYLNDGVTLVKSVA